MEGFITVMINSSQVLLRRDLVVANSEYFNTCLNGGFTEGKCGPLSIQWTGDEGICLLFLSWIGVDLSLADHFTWETMLRFLKCCAYFQVNTQVWTAAKKAVHLPPMYSELDEALVPCWTRQHLEFAHMADIVARVPSKLHRFEYVLAWLDEKSVTTCKEQDELQTTQDFFQVRSLLLSIVQTGAPNPFLVPLAEPLHASVSVLFGQSTGMARIVTKGTDSRLQKPTENAGLGAQRLMAVLDKYPVAGNAVDFRQYWKLGQSGALDSEFAGKSVGSTQA